MFARYLNISESTIEKWETGAKKPSGAALKPLSIVQKHGLQILTWGAVEAGSNAGMALMPERQNVTVAGARQSG